MTCGTSTLDKAGQKPCMVGSPSDSLKINLNFWDGPSVHDGFFLNNSAASGRSNGRSDQFCSKIFADKVGQLQTVYHDHTRLGREMARLQGFIFYQGKKLDHITAISK